MSSKIILDFDGVVCDGTEECALITWLGVHPPSPRTPISSHLIAIPRGFLERFRKIRAYSRVLDHFIVAHRPIAAHIQTRSRFDTVFRCIAADYVRDFVKTATAARTRCRNEEASFWLDLHTLYPGIAELLQDRSGDVIVVTAKDEDSVRTILNRHGIEHTVAEVIGECSQKDQAVRELCARHGISPNTVTFVDDNLTNVLRVATTGANTYWAMWGFHTAEDLAEAERVAVARLRLDDLPTLAAA